MANSPIRTFLFGLENVTEVQAATLNNIYMEVGSAPDSQDMFNRQLFRVHNGTMVGAVLKALTTRSSSLALTGLPILADTQTAMLLSSYFGLPTSTQIASTGVYNHVFKLGPASEPKTCSLLFNNGVRWKRMLGAVSSTLKINQNKEVAPTMDISFIGHAAVTLEVPISFSAGTGTVTRKAVAHGVLSAGVVSSVAVDDPGAGYAGTIIASIPSSVAFTTAAVLGAVTLSGGGVSNVAVTSGGTGYVPAPTVPSIVDAYGPVGFRQLNGTINGLLSDIMSYTLDLNNNRAPRWTGRANADVRRFTRGLADNKLDSVFDYVNYAGSPKATYDAETDLGDWLAEYVLIGAGDVSTGGTGNNRYPAVSIEVPNVIVEDTKEPDDGPEATISVSGQGSYATSPATSVTITLRNTTASYAAS